MPVDVNLVLKAFLELLKILKKDATEKFLEEWKEDEQVFLKALEEGDITAINCLLGKYLNYLQTPRA